MAIRTYAAAAALAVFGMGLSAANATELRLSHQWSTGDVRHKVAEMIANDVAAADVDLDIRIFPSESLLKAREQYNPLSRGQIDMICLTLGAGVFARVAQRRELAEPKVQRAAFQKMQVRPQIVHWPGAQAGDDFFDFLEEQIDHLLQAIRADFVAQGVNACPVDHPRPPDWQDRLWGLTKPWQHRRKTRHFNFYRSLTRRAAQDCRHKKKGGFRAGTPIPADDADDR